MRTILLALKNSKQPKNQSLPMLPHFLKVHPTSVPQLEGESNLTHAPLGAHLNHKQLRLVLTIGLQFYLEVFKYFRKMGVMYVLTSYNLLQSLIIFLKGRGYPDQVSGQRSSSLGRANGRLSSERFLAPL